MEDAAYLALADQHRRALLVALLDGTVDLPELIDDDESETQVRVRLHHQHLPMLADEGYIAWDRAAETVERGARYDEVQPLIEEVAAGFDSTADQSSTAEQSSTTVD